MHVRFAPLAVLPSPAPAEVLNKNIPNSYTAPSLLPHSPLGSPEHTAAYGSWLANSPPEHYLKLYVDVPAPASDEQFLRLASRAAALPLARCPRTGIQVKSPLVAAEWASCFAASRFPDKHAALVIITSIRTGVRLGYTGARNGVHRGGNLQSASDNAAAVDANIEKELQLGRRCRLASPSAFPFFFANPLGVVFKRGGSKPRIIHHLSYPRQGDSVNAHVIDLEVRLRALERAINNIRECGKGCYMAKIDIEAAYRCIPVCPADWPLQGMCWKGSFFFDIVVQFGLASATAIFEYFSSSAEFFAKMLLFIRFLEHYVDDFLLTAKTHEACLSQRDAFLALLRRIGLPYSVEKLEGPVTDIIFLGIKLDSVAMTVSLDAERVRELKLLLAEWMKRTTASRKDLQTLCGLLNFAASVVRSGRTFFSRILDQLRRIPFRANALDQHPIEGTDFHLDIKWWYTFVESWNGISLLPPPINSLPTVIVETDACGTGYGAVCGSEWLRGEWTANELALAQRAKHISMPWLEFRAMVIAAATWGKQWAGQKVLIKCDCKPATEAWMAGSSPDRGLADLIRSLLFLSATLDFHVEIQHVAGTDNCFADWLSRGQVTRFLASAPQHSRSPTIPSPPPIQTW